MSVEKHYERLATSYDDDWAYTPEFLSFMTGAIVTSLDLLPTDVIADVGGGTGLYAAQIAKTIETKTPIYCVDPSAAMLAQFPRDSGVVPVLGSAEEVAANTDNTALSELPHQLDAIVIKEAIHHVENPQAVIGGLAERLRPGGRLLIVMLPKVIDYPLFQTALERFTELQPDPRDIVGAMTAANLEASLSNFSFPLMFSVERYCQMVNNRYMSLLSTFDDDEIAAGVEEIRATHTGPELSFNDTFAFVLGVKPQ